MSTTAALSERAQTKTSSHAQTTFCSGINLADTHLRARSPENTCTISYETASCRQLNVAVRRDLKAPEPFAPRITRSVVSYRISARAMAFLIVDSPLWLHPLNSARMIPSLLSTK